MTVQEIADRAGVGRGTAADELQRRQSDMTIYSLFCLVSFIPNSHLCPGVKHPVEVPKPVEEQIEAYALSENTSVEIAYREAIRRGASELSAPLHSAALRPGHLESRHGFGPQPMPVATEDNNPPGALCTFLQAPSVPSQPVTFEATGTISEEGLSDGLARIGSLAEGIDTDWFTVTHPNVSLIGRGLRGFATSLQELPERVDDTAAGSHTTGSAIYVFEYPTGEYTILEAQVDSSSGEIESFSIRFLTDGHPIDASRYQEIAAQFGLSDLGHTKERDIREVSVTPENNANVEPVNEILENSLKTAGEVVAGLIIKNPLRHREDVRQSFANQLAAEYPGHRNPIDRLSEYEYAYAQLNHEPTEESQEEYSIERIEVQDLSACLQSAGVWNVHIDVR